MSSSAEDRRNLRQSDPEAFAEALDAAFHNAACDVYQVDDGSVVLRFITIAEILEPEGERVLSLHTSPDLREWDVKGFLHYAIEKWTCDDDDEYFIVSEGDEDEDQS